MLSKKSLIAYVYPNISKEKMGSRNPYVENLKLSLKTNGFEIDLSTSSNAFLDLLRNGYKADVVFLNWIEEIPSRRFGILQSVCFSLYAALLKVLSVKIIWLKHNRSSHVKEKFRLKSILRALLRAISNLIITHSRDDDLNGAKRVYFIHHPNSISADSILSPNLGDRLKFDFLIWGNISPYKGILEFLSFIKGTPSFGEYKVCIAGNCSDESYWHRLCSYRGANVMMLNEFVDESTLFELFKQTRFLLFTYKGESILSSGTLIESLVACKRIIGPNCGAFRDLAEGQGFVSVYDSFDKIDVLFRNNVDNYMLERAQVLQFLSYNSWSNFGLAFKNMIYGI